MIHTCLCGLLNLVFPSANAGKDVGCDMIFAGERAWLGCGAANRSIGRTSLVLFGFVPS
jgi:hypothetical protein